jgi:hypothetical protein
MNILQAFFLLILQIFYFAAIANQSLSQLLINIFCSKLQRLNLLCKSSLLFNHILLAIYQLILQRVVFNFEVLNEDFACINLS